MHVNAGRSFTRRPKCAEAQWADRRLPRGARPRRTYPASLLPRPRFLFPKTKNQKDQRQVGLSRKHLTLKLFLGFVPEFLSTHNRTWSGQHSRLQPPPGPSLPAAVPTPETHRSPPRPPPSGSPVSSGRPHLPWARQPLTPSEPGPGAPQVRFPSFPAVPSRDSACPLLTPSPLQRAPHGLAQWPQAPAFGPALRCTRRLQAALSHARPRRASPLHCAPAPRPPQSPRPASPRPGAQASLPLPCPVNAPDPPASSSSTAKHAGSPPRLPSGSVTSPPLCGQRVAHVHAAPGALAGLAAGCHSTHGPRARGPQPVPSVSHPVPAARAGGGRGRGSCPHPQCPAYRTLTTDERFAPGGPRSTGADLPQGPWPHSFPPCALLSWWHGRVSVDGTGGASCWRQLQPWHTVGHGARGGTARPQRAPGPAFPPQPSAPHPETGKRFPKPSPRHPAH